jgi:hypothetical protein
MSMHWLILALAAAVVAIPPLTAGQRIRLETATDGRDHREEAFIALLENARQFGETPGDAPVRLSPDIDAMLDDPESYRGELCRVRGTIEQITKLGRPYDDVWEWFVIEPSDRPVIVFVVDLTDDEQSTFSRGAEIALYARFYKRIDAVVRDGKMHRYAAFVGAKPRLLAVSWGGLGTTGTFFVILLVALLIFVVLLILVRRQRRSLPVRRVRSIVSDSPEELDRSADLPDDPVEALAELRRRAEVERDADH